MVQGAKLVLFTKAVLAFLQVKLVGRIIDVFGISGVQSP